MFNRGTELTTYRLVILILGGLFLSLSPLLHCWLTAFNQDGGLSLFLLLLVGVYPASMARKMYKSHSDWVGIILLGSTGLITGFAYGEFSLFGAHFSVMAFMILAFAVSLNLKINPDEKPILQGLKKHWVLGLCLLIQISAYSSQRFASDFYFFAPFRNTVILASIVAWMTFNRRRKNLLLECMLVLGMVSLPILLYSLFSNAASRDFLSHTGPSPILGGEAIPFYWDVEALYATATLTLPFVFWFAKHRKGHTRWLAIGLGSAIVLGLFARLSWGAIGGLGGGLVFFAFFFMQRRVQKLALGAVAISIGAMLAIFTYSDYAVSLELAIKLAFKYPLGIGQGHFEFIGLKELLEQPYPTSIDFSRGSGIEWLTYLVEAGWTVILVYLAYAIYLTYQLNWLIRHNKLGRSWGACIGAALGSWFVHGFFSDIGASVQLWSGLMLITVYLILARHPIVEK